MSEIPTCIAVRPSVFRAGLFQVLEEAERTLPSLLDEDVLYGVREPDGVHGGVCDVVILDASGREWGPLLAKLERGGVRPNRVLLVEEVRSAVDAANLLALNVAGCIGATETPESLVEKVIAAAEGDWRRSRADLFDAIRQVHKPEAKGVSLSVREIETLTLVARGGQ